MSKKKNRGRVRVRDAEQAIFRPHQQEFVSDKETSREPSRETIVFTMFGSHDYLHDNHMPALHDVDSDDGSEIIDAEDRDEAYAKIIIINDNKQFLVRRDSSGKFFDPLGLFSEGRHNKLRRHTQDREWEWRRTNQKAFNYYVRFLETKNKAHLTNAEREGF